MSEASNMQPYVVLPAQAEDRQQGSRLMWRSFWPAGDPRDVPYWQDGRHTWAMVAKANEQVVATMSVVYSLDNIIRGARLPLAAVWGVGTDPSHRRLGCVKAMFTQAFPRMRDQGLVFSALDPFSNRFYAKFGYAPAEQFMRHVLPSEVIRHLQMPAGIAAREIRADTEFDRVHRLRRTMARFGSRIFVPTTPNPEALPKHWYALERGHDLVGTVSFDLRHRSEGGRRLLAYDIAYESTESLRAVMAQIARLAESESDVEIRCDPQLAVRHLVSERQQITSEISGSMMVRVIDLAGYVRRIQVPPQASDAITIALSDTYCPWNSGTWRLTPDQGRLHLEHCAEGLEPDIRLDAHQFSQIVSGLTPTHLLRELGEIGCSCETAAKIEAIWPAEVFFSYFRF